MQPHYRATNRGWETAFRDTSMREGRGARSNGPKPFGGSKLKTQSTRTRLLASSMICGAAVLASGQAFAQDQGTQVEEFVVTGSRIPQPNLTSTSPITVVGDQ